MNRNLITRRPRRHLTSLPSLFGDNWGDFERLFDSFWAPSPAQEDAVAAFRPRVDVEETKDAYVITAELPGFSEDQVEVTVSDTGKGIDLNAAERIFEPFYSTKTDGMGMGLSISRSIIESHGGAIRAQNSLAGGAEFSFVLRLDENGEEE